MSVYKDAYKTSIGSMFSTRFIENSIKEALISDDGLQNESLGTINYGEYKAIFITGKFSTEADIPLFTHPITINSFQGKNYLVTDLRLFLNKRDWNKKIEDSIKNRVEYNFAKSRALLNLIWLNEGPNTIKNNLGFSANVFSALISETIGKTFALEFNDLITLGVLSEIYYYSLFLEGGVLTEDDKQKLVVHIIRSGRVRPENIFKILDTIKPMVALSDFCDNAMVVIENVRLTKFNSALLLTILKNCWYGVNSSEIISVSLEHPPTWSALVYTALSEKTYKSSAVFKTAERLGKRGVADNFIMSYNGLVKTYSIAEEALIIKDF